MMRRWLAVLTLLPAVASAYPTFIGYGYGSCLQCHFNPYGNGALTDYGRGVYATAIADRPFWSPDASEENLSELSGFLGPKKLPGWVRPSIEVRNMVMGASLNRNPVISNIFMQGDVGVVVKDEESRYLASVVVGYQNTAPFSDLKMVTSREHYVGARLDDNWGLYAGLMDIPFGLRVPDHNAYSRSTTGLAQNDQSHGLLAHYYSEKFEAGVYAFAGNLLQTPVAVRPKGVSATFEAQALGKSRFGASMLASQSDYRQRTLGAVHARVPIAEGSSVINELGFVSSETRSTASRQTSDYLLSQLLLRFERGWHGLFTAEVADSDIRHASTNRFRLAPGVQWFPFQRLELRSDLSCQWTLPKNGSALFDFSWLLQAHVSL